MQYDEVDAEKKQSPTVELRVTNTKCSIHLYINYILSKAVYKVGKKITKQN